MTPHRLTPDEQSAYDVHYAACRRAGFTVAHSDVAARAHVDVMRRLPERIDPNYNTSDVFLSETEE